MDREQLVFALLKPLDMQLGALVAAAKRLPGYDRVQAGAYQQIRKAVRGNFERTNDLKVEGLDNVPTTGGVIFAVNHQSWHDVTAVGAACPRRLHFLAKSEFRDWPVLRRMIDLIESPYIERGGDADGIASVVAMLGEGKAICIFPEGTIPGEERVRRVEVEPHTGLLRGRSGTVRIALAAGVPIIPVGLSGTSAAFPPEVYPRLELLRPPGSAPITVRFGAPITVDDCTRQDDGEVAYEQIRAKTDEVMMAISGLVDHHRNYVPVKVPIEPRPRHDKVGVLLLHGFSSSVKAVSGLTPYLDRLDVPWSMPVLRGHGTRYEDMTGTTADDWYADAEEALLELSEKVDKVVVVGLSMGGLVALGLGMRHGDRIAGVVTLAAALRFKDPLSGLSKHLARVFKYWASPNAFSDAECAKANENYPKFATDAFVSLHDYAKHIEERLPELEVPLLVLHSKKDSVIAPVSANLIYERVSSAHRDIVWFQRSGHEMGQDCEAEDVFRTVDQFIVDTLSADGEADPAADANSN